MRVFVTGASGFIGSAVVPELIGAGHQVVGLARSDASAECTCRRRGGGASRHARRSRQPARRRRRVRWGHPPRVQPRLGSRRLPRCRRADLRAIETLGAALEGTDRAFVIASGTLGLAPGRVVTERDEHDLARLCTPGRPERAAALSFAARGVRSSIVRLSPSVHGEGDHGFIAALIAIARDKGVSGYIGDGSNRWTAVHRFDAAQLFRLALEAAPAGSVLHGVADEGVPVACHRRGDRAASRPAGGSIPPEDAGEHFGWSAASSRRLPGVQRADPRVVRVAADTSRPDH